MKKLVAVIVLGFSVLASANNASLMNCESDQVSINVSAQMTFDQSIRGWSNFRGRAIYKLKDSGKTGTLPVYIMWRNDWKENGQDEQRAILVNLIEGDVAQAKKQAATDGGYMGFGSLMTRANLKGQYAAKWQLHRAPELLKEFSFKNHDLKCETK